MPKPVTELAREAGLNPGTVAVRVHRGMSLAQALATPVTVRKFPDAKMIGRRFGLLKVTARHRDDDRSGRPRYHVSCRCGRTKVVRKYDLISTNGTRSCGCMGRPSLIGRRFGALTVIADGKHVPGAHMYRCRCDCGVERDRQASALRRTGAGVCSSGCPLAGRVFVMFHGRRVRLTQAIHESGQSSALVRNRLASGWTVDEAIDMPSGLRRNGLPVSSPVIVGDKSYPSLSHAARAFGLSPSIVQDRVKVQGWSMEDALTTPKKWRMTYDEARVLHEIKKRLKQGLVMKWVSSKGSSRRSPTISSRAP